MTILKQLCINVPLIEALEKNPGNAKFMKNLVIKKRTINFEEDVVTRSFVQ